MFSPLASPTGMIVYDLTTHYPPPSHLGLSPFEIYREPLVIIAVADGAELGHVSYKSSARRSLNGNGLRQEEYNVRELHQDLEDIRDRYPKALVHQLLLFDYVHEKSGIALPEGLVAIPPPADCKRTTLKTIMCDISSLLLAEMTTLAKSLQALNTIESPTQLQGNRQFNGAVWPSEQPDGLGRRNSQFALPENDSRSSSPATGGDRNHVRMSMPAQLFRSTTSDSNTSSPTARPGTPTHTSTSDLPTTLEDMTGAQVGGLRGLPARLGTPNSVRENGRVPVTGFGSGSVSERSRNKGKGRIGIVIGSLYIAAGRWNDALRELVEGANIAKSNLDHLWHAKALDYILVSMLMLAWTGLDFQIPQVCYITPERATTPSNTIAEPKSPASNRLVSLQNLETLLPELLDRILNLYARTANIAGESLPQYPFSETVIRFSKLMSAVHLSGGKLDDDVLQLLVLGTPFRDPPNVSTPRLNIQPTRTEIARTLLQALPKFSTTENSPTENLTLVDRIIILSGIASVYGSLGYNRKKAMVIRNLISFLTPGLVQARLKGAAEMGVHPAAGLAALNSTNGNTNGAGALDLGEGDMEQGVDVFLGLLNQIYGAVTFTSASSIDGPVDDSDEAAIRRIIDNAACRYFGGRSLKIDVLRSSIDLSEALPDFNGVLRFSADLLRTAGSGVAPGPRSEDALPFISRDEQVKLATNIYKTLNAASHLGFQKLAAEYWDEFLVRGVELEALAPSRTPIPHSRNELPGATAAAASREVNPFIYNPFLRAPDAAAVEHLMVAGEGAIFRVTLQNPYEFDLEIESIRLESEGADFQSSVQKTVIGPYRTQILSVRGTPKAPGALRITGCIIKVRGCRERRFPIFAPWSPQMEVKVKTIGLAAVFEPKFRPSSVSSAPVKISPTMPVPTVKPLGLNVIDRQPIVAVKSSTLSQSALMVLEGERQRFSIVLENLSEDTPVDLLLFSFKDSTQNPLQTAMSNRDASPAELYEYELILARKQALRWIQEDGEKPYIKPRETATFVMEILGKPGLTSATVHVDYAYLGVPQTEVQERFHTRQVSLPLTVTVNASIELTRMDVLPLTGKIPQSLWSKVDVKKQEPDYTPEGYCLLVLDLRNAWPSNLKVCLDVINGRTIEEEVLPGNTSRVMFPIRRIFLEDPAAAIPALDPSRQRQFVVSTGRISADSERAAREAFWYREEILKMLSGTWETKSGLHRKGEIELRGIRLSPRVIETVKIEDLGIDLSINDQSSSITKHQVNTDTFLELKIRITNRSAERIQSLLRVQPSVCNYPHTQSLDLSKKLIWNGILQEALPPIPGRESIELSIGITPLCRGEFEINASVEETRLGDIGEELRKGKEPKGQAYSRARANTRTMMDSVLGARERRIWHSREPCVLVVRDGDDDSDDGDGEEDEDEEL